MNEKWYLLNKIEALVHVYCLHSVKRKESNVGRFEIYFYSQCDSLNDVPVSKVGHYYSN